jgi:hypothetical protein
VAVRNCNIVYRPFPRRRYARGDPQRLHLTSTFDGFHDANSGRNVRDYQTQLAYDLTAGGSTSVPVGYDRGTSKDTLISLKQFLVTLNYKY